MTSPDERFVMQAGDARWAEPAGMRGRTLVFHDRDGPLGTLEISGDRLTGSTPSIQRMADAALARLGSAQAAYDHLAGMDNGYVQARQG